MVWSGMLLGSGFEGSGTSAADVSTMLGDRAGPVAAAFVSGFSAGGGPFLVSCRPGVPVKPFTLFVPRVEPADPGNGEVTWGAAQAGVAAGVVEAVRLGVIPTDVAETALLVCSVWVDPGATVAHSDVIFLNNRAATLTALANAGHERPALAEVLDDTAVPWNHLYRP